MDMSQEYSSGLLIVQIHSAMQCHGSPEAQCNSETHAGAPQISGKAVLNAQLSTALQQAQHAKHTRAVMLTHDHHI